MQRVAVAAFGDPVAPATFSGYPAAMTAAMREGGVLGPTLSLRPSAAAIVLQGGVGFRPGAVPPLGIDRRWLWSPRGIESMTRTLARRSRAAGVSGPLVQIGTQARAPAGCRPHAMLTDMTVAQARRAGRFAVSRLGAAALDRAEELQAAVVADADVVLALSQWTADSLVADLGVARDAVTVVHAGPNVDLRTDDPAERPPGERGRLLFVGIDWERKGGPLLLEAFRRAAPRHPHARLVVVGCEPQVDHPQVEVVGFLDRAVPAQDRALRDEYARAAAFVLPSHFDPFPNAILEAATARLPTVAFDNGSRREVVEDGHTGWLVGEESPQALAARLDEVLSLPASVTRAAGDAALERLEQRFGWDRVVQRTLRALGVDGA